MRTTTMSLRRSYLTVLLSAMLNVTWTPVFAADSDKHYQVRAIDAVESCAGLNGALGKAKDEDNWGTLYGYSLYTMGYMTGINRLASNTYDIAGKKNTKTLMVWLEKYCAEHPDDSFDNALYRLTAELYPHRTTAAPDY
jgi:hypothetical protein